MRVKSIGNIYSTPPPPRHTMKCFINYKQMIKYLWHLNIKAVSTFKVIEFIAHKCVILENVSWLNNLIGCVPWVIWREHLGNKNIDFQLASTVAFLKVGGDLELNFPKAEVSKLSIFLFDSQSVVFDHQKNVTLPCPNMYLWFSK